MEFRDQGISSPWQARSFSRYCQKHRTTGSRLSSMIAFGSFFTAGIYVTRFLNDPDTRSRIIGHMKKMQNYHRSLVLRLKKRIEASKDIRKERNFSHVIPEAVAADSECATSPTDSQNVSDQSLASIVKVESLKKPFLLDSLTLLLDQKIGFVCRKGFALTGCPIVRERYNNRFRITTNDGRIFYGTMPFQGDIDFVGHCSIVEFDAVHDIPRLSLKADPGRHQAVTEVFVYELNDVTSENNNAVSSVPATLITNLRNYNQKRVILHDRKIRPEKPSNAAELSAKGMSDLFETLRGRVASISPYVTITKEKTCEGSPIVDQDCKIVGIVSTGTKQEFDVKPIGHLQKFLDEYCSGSISFSALGKLGLQCVTLKSSLVTRLVRSNDGTLAPQVDGHLVSAVYRNSISDKCGVKPGDIITHVNNEPLHSIYDLALRLKSDRIVKVRVKRGQNDAELVLKF